MRKIFSLLTIALTAVAALAQQPVLTFEKTEHDFGKINEADGRVTTIFEFKNEGMEPLVLSNVRASCGCTTPKWTKEPVEPGQTGQITVTYNPNGRPGRFQKTITVTSNATESTMRIFIKGEVIPKPAKPVNQYPVQMGELSLKAKSLDFGIIKKGDQVTREIEYANHTDHELRIGLATRDQDKFLHSQTTLETVKPNETGKFMFIFDAPACNIYGPVEVSAYVVVNDKLIEKEEFRLSMKAEVTEDFSSLTVAERQQAPIAVVEKNIDFGSLQAGKKYIKALPVQNAGASPLQIRRVYLADQDGIAAAVNKNVLKSGKRAELRVNLNTMLKGKPMEPGKYSRTIILITNDPEHSRQAINVTWVIE